MIPRRRLGPHATRVAALAALVIALIAAALVVSASRDRYELRATFDDVRGLIPGGYVTAGSQRVGEVSDVSFDENDNPVVTMVIEGDFELHRGAFANIKSVSNVGAVTRTVDLTEGDPTGPELDDGAMLGPSETDQPVDFDVAASALDPPTRRNLAGVLAGLEASIRDRGPDFARTLRHSSRAANETASLLGQVNEDGEALRTILDDGGRVVAALASSPAELGEAAERTARLLELTAGRQRDVARSIRLLGPALARGRETLERLGAATPNLRELVERSRPLVSELGPLTDALEPAIDASEPFLRETRGLIREAPEALRAQRPVLRGTKPLLVEFDPALSSLNPFVDRLRVRSPEAVSFFQLFADALSNYDVNGHVVRNTLIPIQVPRISTSQGGEIGPSESGPGLVEPPFARTPGVLEGEPWEDWEDSLIGGDGG